jgi:2-keto-4-pentenoate hydratase/2-oxohepta-3-ene-1,7-dioic acid hydratase in catechol pathway
MRWVRYDHQGQCDFGVLEGDTIAQVDGIPFDNPARTGYTVALDKVRLLPPVIPPTFYAAGINYLRHVHNAAAAGLHVQVPKQADIGYRAVNALIGNDASIVVPADSSGKVQFEGELAVVIGREAKHLSEKDALSCVFGYTIGNDVSERTWQKSDRTFWRAKNADTFKPMGPWIVTGIDIRDMTTNVRINGRLAHSFPTAKMLFSPGEVISDVSRYNTLSPGDVVWLGTDEVPEAVKPGDLIEIEITGIGTLRNRVVAEA